MPHVTRVATCALALLVASGGLSGCSSSSKAPAGPATFVTQEGFSVQAATQPCLLHQADAPTREFMGGPSSSPAVQLPFMAYLTANGTKAFCDGKPATGTDKKWADLYVTLTNQPGKVTGITGA
jgi:hypothetical protein